MAKGLRATIMHELRLRGKSNCKSAVQDGAQRRLVRKQNKASLSCKQGLFTMQASLVLKVAGFVAARSAPKSLSCTALQQA